MSSNTPAKTSAITNLMHWFRSTMKTLTGANRRLKGVALVVLTIVVVAGGLLARFVFFSPYTAMQNRTIGAGITVSGSAVPKDIKAVTTKLNQAPFTATQLISPIMQITPSRQLPAPITLRFKLNRHLTASDVALVATSETPGGSWTLLQPTISHDGWYATVQTTHLSLLGMLWFNVKSAASEFTKQVLAEASGDLLSQAEKPHCDNEAQARHDSYAIASSAKDTLYWCFGVEGGVRILKIVNRMRYTLEVTHPGFTVKNLAGPTIEFDQLARIGSGQTTMLYPFEEVDYTVDLAAGKKAQISTDYSGYAESLHQLAFGVTSLINILVWAKAEAVGLRDQPLTRDAWVRTARYMKSFLDVKDCFNAIMNLKTGTFFVDCFNWDALKKVFGWKGLLLAPITFIGSVGAFFLREFNAIGDLIKDRDKYQISVRRLGQYQGLFFTLPDSSPGDITVGSDGNLWFTAFRLTDAGRSDWIGRMTPDGHITTFKLPDTAADQDLGTIAAGPDGNIWFTLAGIGGPPAPTMLVPGHIGRITPAGKVTIFPAFNSDSNPYGLAGGLDGNVWFTDSGNVNIGRITPSGKMTEFPIPTVGGLSAIPFDIAAGADGNIWFSANGAIGRVARDGKMALFPTDMCPNVSLCDLTAGSDNNLWFTDGGNGVIGRITVNGHITKFSAKSWPLEIAAGSDGNLWFTIDSANGNTSSALGRITPGGTIMFPVPSVRNYSLLGIAAGPDGDLWITGQNSAGQGVILRIAP